MNWRQLQAILWLRWRLSRNQFLRGGRLSAVLSTIFAALLILGAVIFAIMGLAGGVAAGRLAPPEVLLLICDAVMAAFLFFWMIGVLTELQRSESIDLNKLLHLPLTLKQVFLFNFAASHVTPSLMAFLPLMAGLSLGIAFGGGPRMLLLGPVFIAVMLMITAWTYCLRGWLAGLMADRRRGRNIVVWVTLIFVGLAQLPHLVLRSGLFEGQKARRAAAERVESQVPELFIDGHILIPPAWVGYSAYSLKRGDYFPPLGTAVVAALLAAAGLRRSYTLTLRYYRNAETGSARKEPASTATPAAVRKRLMVEYRIPFLRDDTAALALATLRSLLRAPEFKMTLFMPLVILLVIAGSLVGKLRSAPNPMLVPFAVTAGVVLVPFTLAALLANVFGLDRGGFRALVLSPMPRDQILLARNAAVLPVVVAGAVLVLTLAGVFFHAAIPVLITGALQAVAGYVMFAILCNYLAILAPYRYGMNSIQVKKFKAATLLSALVSMAVWPIFGVLLAIPPGAQFVCVRLGMPGWIPVNVLAALVICTVVCWLYRLILPEQGRLLQRRELKILREVTAETE